jgi:hypothetical protein
MVKKIQEKIDIIKAEMEVKDGIIATLVKVISENNIRLPIKILNMLEALYVNRKKEGEKS